ncbi:MAG: ATP-binding cassette domain-containing protein [Dehalococcoidia bacterium]|nr:ATP-binding cassette domain-containing protein [Dehalococcoidia bacterium]
MLRVHDVWVSYGPILALQGVSLEVKAGSITAVLGANGAGKSTTLRTISGLLRPTRGYIEYEGRQLDRMSPEEIVEAGVVQVPEGRQLFTELSVMENLRLGAYTRRDHGVAADLERMQDLFPILRQRLSQPAGLLSGGEQQQLAIARALMARPRLLLLDEPSLGLAPLVTRSIYEVVREINQQGVTVLVVEQNVNLVLDVASYGYVVETGRIAMEDEAASLRQNETVRRSYLGY